MAEELLLYCCGIAMMVSRVGMRKFVSEKGEVSPELALDVVSFASPFMDTARDRREHEHRAFSFRHAIDTYLIAALSTTSHLYLDHCRRPVYAATSALRKLSVQPVLICTSLTINLQLVTACEN
jgi:hypothetical protein